MTTRNEGRIRFRETRAILVCGFLLAAPAAAHGALLNLTRLHYPLVYAGNVSVNYDADGGAGGGLLTASGTPFITLQLDDSDSGTSYFGSFALMLELVSGGDNDGSIVPGGQQSLNITYKPDGFMGASETIFSSTKATAFGFWYEDKFEFLFTQNVDTEFVDAGEPVGVIVTANSIPDFNEPDIPVFTDDFSNGLGGESNTFYLPEPGTAVLMAVGAVAVFRRRRRRGSSVM